MTTTSTHNLINWIKNRLENKYQDYSCSEFLNRLSLFFDNPPYDDKIVDQICSNLFIGFDNQDKDESSMFDIGYSRAEKEQIKTNIKNILFEYHKIISDQ